MNFTTFNIQGHSKNITVPFPHFMTFSFEPDCRTQNPKQFHDGTIVVDLQQRLALKKYPTSRATSQHLSHRLINTSPTINPVSRGSNHCSC